MTAIPISSERLKRRWKIKRGIVFTFLLVTGIWVIGVGCLVTSFGSGDWSRQPVAAIIVLGAADTNDRPSPVFEARLKHAIDLYQRGLAPLLVFTGGRGEGDRLSEAEVGRRYALAAGVPSSAILIESNSTTTFQNLEEAGRVMDHHGINRQAIFVSDPFHLLRVAWMAHRLDFAVFTSPTPNTRYQSWETKFPFLMREIYFLHHYAIFWE